MQAPYLVNSCSVEDVPVEVTVNGRPAQAKVRGVVLELVSAQGSGSLMLRYLPEDADAEVAAFPTGAAVTVTVTPDA